MTGQDNILPQGDDKREENLSEDTLMAYLEGRLTPAAQHEVEQWLADEGMESDAIEGLQAIGAGEARQSVGRLNHNLRKSLHGKKHRRKPLQSDYLTWVAIAIILLLAVAAYIVVRKSIR